MKIQFSKLSENPWSQIWKKMKTIGNVSAKTLTPPKSTVDFRVKPNFKSLLSKSEIFSGKPKHKLINLKFNFIYFAIYHDKNLACKKKSKKRKITCAMIDVSNFKQKKK